MTVSGDLEIWRLLVRGKVQGVGFRPFVWRLATDLGLRGTVRNTGGQVEIEVLGRHPQLVEFARRLSADAPPRALVERVESAAADSAAQDVGLWRGFSVLESSFDPGAYLERLFPPDLAICAACVAELFDPGDRRYRYPFINCTDCGPRASIIDTLPYDRKRTTMSDFPMCVDCQREYSDPADRRFHAEPVACAVCGPQLYWRPGSHSKQRTTASSDELGPVGQEALDRAVAQLLAGQIVAIKGIGGYHLACDASSEPAVARLRAGKLRWAKPFAVLVADLALAEQLAQLDPVTRLALLEPAAPIVLCSPPRALPPAGRATHLAPSVLVGVRQVGLMLPYTGLHHLLMRAVGRPLVLTSGNRAEEPICLDPVEAEQRLGGIVDGFLHHDRRIRSRYEDSVVGSWAGGQLMLRRGRGYAPEPLTVPVPAGQPVLAVGAQAKHTFTLLTGDRAYVASHTGDLEDQPTFAAFEQNLAHLASLIEAEPHWIAHDLHPGYLSTRFAAQQLTPPRRIAVQHHHAHIAACAAEHGIQGPVIGIALDGLGLGDDGTLWGGEILLANLARYRRLGRFLRAPLPGGEAAVRNPWRMLLGYLKGAECPLDQPGQPVEEWADPQAVVRLLDRFDPVTTRVVIRQVARGINSPVASSAGRLFDVASCVLGLRDSCAYEGEAAIWLEQAADPAEHGLLPYQLLTSQGLEVFDARPTLAALITEMDRGRVPVPVLAARFHNTVAEAVAALAAGAAQGHGVETVCLGGGVFANALLLAGVRRRLVARGLTVAFPQRLPAGDGGISYGQAVVAAARLSAEYESGLGLEDHPPLG